MKYRKNKRIDGAVSEIGLGCEKQNIGIHVMKPFAGGSLLRRGISHLGKALTPYQCLKYSLDRPAVQSCLVGVQELEEMQEILSYNTVKEEERDYSILGELSQNNFTNDTCIYCNHCQPCPKGIDIGIVNKYLDLALAGDEIAMKHYQDLRVHASDCIKCGNCDKNCPFRVKVQDRMQKAIEVLGM